MVDKDALINIKLAFTLVSLQCVLFVLFNSILQFIIHYVTVMYRSQWESAVGKRS